MRKKKTQKKKQCSTFAGKARVRGMTRTEQSLLFFFSNWGENKVQNFVQRKIIGLGSVRISKTVPSRRSSTVALNKKILKLLLSSFFDLRKLGCKIQ